MTSQANPWEPSKADRVNADTLVFKQGDDTRRVFTGACESVGKYDQYFLPGRPPVKKFGRFLKNRQNGVVPQAGF
jgi:hypothetical protein